MSRFFLHILNDYYFRMFAYLWMKNNFQWELDALYVQGGAPNTSYAPPNQYPNNIQAMTTRVAESELESPGVGGFVWSRSQSRKKYR